MQGQHVSERVVRKCLERLHEQEKSQRRAHRANETAGAGRHGAAIFLRVKSAFRARVGEASP